MQLSAKGVDAGARSAEESGTALMRITGQLNEISNEIGQIATATQQQSVTTSVVADNITDISSAAATFLNSSTSLTEKLEQLVGISEGMKKSTEAFTIPANELIMLDTAKTDHLAFVGRIERCLDGKESVQSDKLADHTCCRFGKWYFSKGQELCGHSQSFRAINPPHEKFHQIAKEAVDLHANGKDAEAYKCLTEAQDLSGQIVALLDRVAVECGGTRKV